MSIAKTGLAAFRSDTTTTARVLHTKGYWTGGSPSTSQGLIMAQSLWVLHRARELCHQVHTVALEYVYRYDRASMTSPRHNRPRTKSQPLGRLGSRETPSYLAAPDRIRVSIWKTIHYTSSRSDCQARSCSDNSANYERASRSVCPWSLAPLNQG